MDYIPTEDLAFYILDEIVSEKSDNPEHGNFRILNEVIENVQAKYAVDKDATDGGWAYLLDRRFVKGAQNGNLWLVALSPEGIKWLDEKKMIVSERDIQKKQHDQIIANSVESNRVSKEANEIAQGARFDAKMAIIVAIISMVIALCSLGLSYCQNKQSNPQAPSPASSSSPPPRSS